MLLHLDYLPFQSLTCYGCGYSTNGRMPPACPECRMPFTTIMITLADGSRTVLHVEEAYCGAASE